MSAEAAGPVCASGGVRIEAGLDADRDGTLAGSEVSTTSFVCTGATGATGASGATGAAGSTGANGLDTLLVAADEPAGANCAAGGTRYQTGLDANRSGALDPAEVSSTRYTCNGTTGATGAVGPQGPAGPSGLSVLLTSTPVSAGSSCRYGGTRIDSGLDLDLNGTLGTSEVTATSFVCNGAGVTWSVATADRALSLNGGVIASSASRLSLALPASPAVGDIVQVTGAGAGGWKITQNAGERIVTSGVSASTETGSRWATRDAGVSCKVVRTSNNGNLVATVALFGDIRVSTNGGASWVNTSAGTGALWQELLATSSSGSTVMALKTETASPFGRSIQVSTDSGATFAPAPGLPTTVQWSTVAASGDGSVLIAATQLFFDGRIYLSLDGGTTWALAPTSQTGNWRAAGASLDGSILAVAHVYLGTSFFLVSTDRGASWTVRNTGTRDWVAFAMSGDGQRWVAADRDRQLYLSTDQGVTWTATESERPWTDVSISSDGRRLLASTSDGSVVTSGDGGLTWSLRTPYSASLDAVALAGNASRVYGCHSSSGLVFSQPVAVGSFSTTGTSGYLAGSQYQTVSLQFLGDGIWNVLSYVGSSFEAE